MQRRIERKFNPAKNAQDRKAIVATKINEKAEMEQVNALYSLINNRYTKQVEHLELRNINRTDCFTVPTGRFIHETSK
jgi:hypothetical protein